MKVSALLLLVVLQVAARPEATAQVTLKEKGTPLEKVLKAIKKQSKYDLFFDENLVKAKGRPVIIDVTNVPVEEALAAVFRNQDQLSYSLNGKIISVKAKEEKKINQLNEGMPPQVKLPLPIQINISGRVIDSSGVPLQGATITIKGNNAYTSTNKNGEFNINANEGDVLTVSFIGYEPRQITVTKSIISTTYNLVITLRASIAKLEEVEVRVNTGYQKIDIRKVIGSYVKVDSTLFNRSVGANILTRLEDVTPGLLFDNRENQNNRLQIRGLYTLNGQISQPLIVVDNFPYDGNLIDINPNDVQDITILRDAATASLWGARAGNGVIVITTKKGKFNQRPVLTISSNINLVEKTNLKDLRLIPSSEFIGLEKFLFQNGYYDADIADLFTFRGVSPVVEILNNERNGVISSTEAEAKLNILRSIDNRNQFSKLFYQNQLERQITASISTGGNNFNTYFSAGVDKNLLSLVGNEYQRLSLRTSNIFKLAKNIQIDFGLSYTNSISQNNNPGGYSSWNVAGRKAPIYMNLVNDSGGFNAFNGLRQHYIDTVGGGQLLDWNQRPMEELANSDVTEKSASLLANLGLSVQLLKGLSLELNYQYLNTETNSKNYYSSKTFFTRNLINTFTNLNTNDPNLRFPVPRGGILDLRKRTINSNNGRGQLNYNTKLAKGHALSALAGGEIRESIIDMNAHRSYGYTGTLQQARVNYVTNFPTLPTNAFTEIIPLINNPFSYRIDRFVSYFANLNYNLLDKYSIYGSARKDASNIFGVKTNEKGRPFWSVGMAWDISRERFYKLKWMIDLKLRGSYGYSGNIDPSVSGDVLITYDNGPFQVVNIPYAGVLSFPNPRLRWEKVKTFNLGLDFTLLTNRLSGKIEYYTKKSSDVFTYSQVDPTSGVGFMVKNSASIIGNGINVELTAKVINRKDFKWTSVLNINNDNFKLQSINFPQVAVPPINDGSSIMTNFLAPDLFGIMSYRWAGLNPTNGDPQIYVQGKVMSLDTASRYITSSDLKYVGSNVPKWFGNIINNFEYKGITLSFNITYKLAYYFRKPSIDYAQLLNGYVGDVEFKDRWQKPGDEAFTNVPSLRYPNTATRDAAYVNSDINILKGDNVRLRDIRLSYSLDKSTFKKLPFNRMNVFIYAGNLNLILWKANNNDLDPDYAGKITPSKIFSFGTSFNF